MSKEQRATTPDLFQVCRRYYSQPVASVASELLFWSQCGHNKLRGRAGFFKQDAELSQVIGKDASSIRRALSRICAKAGEDRPEALFEIAHGPKPGQRSGRVRWLFRKPRGDEMIREALCLAEARREMRSASINRSRKAQPVGRIRPHQSAQNERTLYQKDLSESQSEALSSTPEQREKAGWELLKENREELKLKENDREELKRFVTLWNASCAECDQPTLAWLESDVRRLAPRLAETIRHLRLSELSDDELSKRLRLLCGKRSISVFARIGSRFSEYNADGLLIETLAKHGPRVWRAVEAELSELVPKPRSVPELPVSAPEKPLTDEEKARELERLTETWNKLCVERGRPTAQWSRDAVDQHSPAFLHFIRAARLHQIPDQELLIRLGIVVDFFMNHHLVGEHYLAAFTLKHFVSHGVTLFRQTLDAGGNAPSPG
jgi:hypothetical protein